MLAPLWGLWSGAALSAYQATLPQLHWMLATRVLEGMSHLVIVVAAPTLIGALSATRHSSATLSLWSTFFSVAFTILVFLGLPLVEARGIPALFWAHAVWMAGFAVVLTFALKPIDRAVPEALSVASILRRHVDIYRAPNLCAPAAGWLFYTFCFLAILTVIPPFIPENWRVWTLGAMPLVSILSSMSLGVLLLRKLAAVKVAQLGFGLCLMALICLWFAPGAPWACLALAGAFGLVQGATFAAVPQLAPQADAQALSYGALAQAGNLGNTLGTPLLLVILSVAGYGGMIWVCAAIMGAGALTHFLFARHRQAANVSEPV